MSANNNNAISRYSELGKKKRQKVIEGTGLLLTLLRNNIQNDESIITANDENVDADFIPERQGFSQHEEMHQQEEEICCSSKENPLDEAEEEDVVLDVNEEELEANQVQEMSEIPTPSYINYDFTGSITEVLCEYKEFQTTGRNNFIKGCKWSPDGCSLLTNSDDRIIRAFSLPDKFYEYKFQLSEEEDSNCHLKPTAKIRNGELVYDFCWYPFVSYPNTHCTLVAVTSRDHPIHLWDIQSNSLTATFSAINHVDELTSAHSLAFSLDGRKLYAGFKNTVRIFDFLRPGPQIDTKDTRGNKNLMNGQNGIVSCIAACPTYEGLFVCGSYHKTLALYSDNLKDPQCVLHGHSAGITHVCYHSNGNYVYSGTRKNNELFCWDMRNLGSVLYTFERYVDTNQRIYFDIDKNNQFLMSGNTNGDITIWNTENSDLIRKISTGNSCVNGVSFNPFLPLLASSSGQRLCESRLFEDDANLHTTVHNNHVLSESIENCIKLWHVS